MAKFGLASITAMLFYEQRSFAFYSVPTYPYKPYFSKQHTRFREPIISMLARLLGGVFIASVVRKVAYSSESA